MRNWTGCWQHRLSPMKAKTMFRSFRPSRSVGLMTSGPAAITGCCAGTQQSWPTLRKFSAVNSPPPYNVNYANSADKKWRTKSRPILNDDLGKDFEANILAAVSLQISQTSTNSAGGTALAMIADNFRGLCSGRAYLCNLGRRQPEWVYGNDVFVLAQPIGNDTIHSFDVAHDRVRSDWI